MLNHFSWDNISTEAFETASSRIIVRKSPSISRPARKYDRYSVPGRSGDIYIPQDAFDNYTQVYDLFLYTDEKGSELNELCEKIAAWLYTPNGYAELVDDHEDGYLRKAFFTGPFTVENDLTIFGRTTITFNCRPERFLKAGNDSIPGDEWLSLTNPTRQIARPVLDIEIPVSFSGIKIQTLYDTVTKTWIYTKQIGATHLTVDSDARAWMTEVPYAGKNVTLNGEMPLLREGETLVNVIGLDASNNELTMPDWTITPRWWTL
ncbi:MAG: hypothetical protein J6112_03620 [Clostridia bacterium]|nr:hypothetical protein [Clostridia bacterium]